MKDVIAVQQQNMPAVSGELLDTYDDLDGRLVEVAAVMPPGMIEQEMQELTAGITSRTALDALADVEILTLDMSRDGESIDWDTKFYFSNKESANDVRGLIPLLSLVIGAIDLPGGSVVQHPENVLSLLPQVLTRSEFRTDGSCLIISSDLTLADIDAMSAVKERTGLEIAIDGVIHNTIALKLEMGEVRLAATMGEQSLMNETLEGGSIDANSTSNFQHSMVIPLEQLGERELQITVDTAVEARGFSIPLSAAINLTTPDIASLIVVPEMDMAVDFGDLAADGLHIGLQTVMTNTNPFGVEIGDVQIEAAGESGNVLFTSEMKGLSVGPESAGTMTGEMLMPLDMLNEPVVIMTIRTEAGFAGVSLPVSARMTVNMPDIGSLVSVSRIEMSVEPSWVADLPLPGLRVDVAGNMTNEGSIDLNIDSIQASFYDSKGEYVVKMTVPGGTIGAHSSRRFSGAVTLSALQYSRLLGGGSFTVALASEARIADVETSFPFEAAITIEMSSLIKIPEMDFGVDFGELTADDLHLSLCTNLSNGNPFGIDVGDLLIVATNASGKVIGTCSLNSLSLQPNSAGSLSGDILVPLEEISESTIVLTLQAQAEFGGVTLTPIKGKVVVKMPGLKSLVTTPEVDLGVTIGKLTPEGLRIALEADVTNPNPFALGMGRLHIVARDQSGDVILTSSIDGCNMGPDSSVTLRGSLLLPLEAMDEPTIVISAQTEAQCDGITLAVTAKVILVNMPDVMPVETTDNTTDA